MFAIHLIGNRIHSLNWQPNPTFGDDAALLHSCIHERSKKALRYLQDHLFNLEKWVKKHSHNIDTV